MSVEQKIDDLKSEIADLKSDVKEKAGGKPLISIGIAFGVGTAFGFLLTAIV